MFFMRTVSITCWSGTNLSLCRGWKEFGGVEGLGFPPDFSHSLSLGVGSPLNRQRLSRA